MMINSIQSFRNLEDEPINLSLGIIKKVSPLNTSYGDIASLYSEGIQDSLYSEGIQDIINQRNESFNIPLSTTRVRKNLEIPYNIHNFLTLINSDIEMGTMNSDRI
jgi:hypothetical protein